MKKQGIEKKNDFNLPVVERKDIESELVRLLHSDFKTEIKIPLDNIAIWKNQFL